MFSDRLAKTAAAAAIIFCCYKAVVALGGIDLSDNQGMFGNLVVCLTAFAQCVLWALAAALIGVAAFLRGFTDAVVDQILMPRIRLKAPPPLLSPVRGLLECGNYPEAERRLEEVLEETPECPLAWKLAFDMRLEFQHDPEGAMLVAEAYFRLPKREYAPENRRLLLTYAELAEAAGRREEALSLIAAELRRHRRSYSTGDRRLLRQRIAVS